VEPAIALSIAFIAIENVIRPKLGPDDWPLCLDSAWCTASALQAA